ncbi:MAG: hypothetical protein ACE5JI_06865 [Acidobacteriota bacterium]
MASKVTGNVSLGAWKAGGLPPALALQGLGLFMLAFWLGPPSARVDMGRDAKEAGSLFNSPPVRVASNAQVPADFLREQIRLPRFPNSEKATSERQLAPDGGERPETGATGPSLDVLRVDSVALQAPAVVQVALALPNVPDHIAPGAISLTHFGEGGGRPGRRGRVGGWGGSGGVGIGGVGPAGSGGGGCTRNPAGGLGTIVERSIGYPR